MSALNLIIDTIDMEKPMLSRSTNYVILLALLGYTNVSSAEVLINEILIDPVGSDGSNEWLELCNNGEDDVTSGWMVQSAGNPPFADKYGPAGTVIPTGGYLLLGPGIQQRLSKWRLSDGWSSYPRSIFRMDRYSVV